MNESTPLAIPSSLATMLEFAGDAKGALAWYEKALTGASLSFAMQSIDQVVYRTVLLTSRRDDLTPAQRRDAVVRVLANDHVRYNPHLHVSNVAYPARRMALEVGEAVCKEAGDGRALDDEVAKELGHAVHGA